MRPTGKRGVGIWRCWLTVLSSGEFRKLEFGEEVIVAPIPELVDGDVFGELSSRSSLARLGELGDPSEPLASDWTPDSSAEKAKIRSALFLGEFLSATKSRNRGARSRACFNEKKRTGIGARK